MHPKSIEIVSESYLCCNCGACKVVCPKDAIEIRCTSVGRFFAAVNERCIDCGICTKVCPTLVSAYNKSDGDPYVGNISDVYVGKSIDEDIFLNSQSGGVCTALLTCLFDSGKIDAALVCRMEYGTPVPVVKPVFITSPKELSTTQKSCYSPVVLLDSLKNEVKKYSSIAVVGIGCQLEGLVNIEAIRKDIKDRIYCKIGLICDRTLCNTIQNVYSSYAPNFHEVSIAWRCKYLGGNGVKFRYEDAPLVISDRTGQNKVFPNIYRFTLKDMFTSPRCRVCPNKLNVCSDITLGDPWRMPDIDMENGESVIAVRSSNGAAILNEACSAKYINISSRPIEQLVKGQLTRERKIQTSEYSKAFHVLRPKVSTGLLTPKVETTQEGVEKACSDLKKFVERESGTTDEIVKEARKQISKAIFRESIMYRIMRRIFKIIRK